MTHATIIIHTGWRLRSWLSVCVIRFGWPARVAGARSMLPRTMTPRISVLSRWHSKSTGVTCMPLVTRGASTRAARRIQIAIRQYQQQRPVNDRDPITLEPRLGLTPRKYPTHVGATSPASRRRSGQPAPTAARATHGTRRRASEATPAARTPPPCRSSRPRRRTCSA